jgi:hypothetical protein
MTRGRIWNCELSAHARLGKFLRPVIPAFFTWTKSNYSLTLGICPGVKMMLLENEYAPQAQHPYQEYDDLGRLIVEIIHHGDGSRTDTRWDQSNNHDWWATIHNYNNNGDLTRTYVAWDSGWVHEDFYDPVNFYYWSHISDHYNFSLQKTYNAIRHDDDSLNQTLWDQSQTENWWSIERSFDAGGSMRFERVVFDDASRRVMNVNFIGYIIEQSISHVLSDGTLYSEKYERREAGLVGGYTKIWDVYNQNDWWYLETRMEIGTGQLYQVGQRDSGEFWIASHDELSGIMYSSPVPIPSSARGISEGTDLISLRNIDLIEDRYILDGIVQENNIIHDINGTDLMQISSSCSDDDMQLIREGSDFFQNLVGIVDAMWISVVNGRFSPALTTALGASNGVVSGLILGAQALSGLINAPPAQVAGHLAGVGMGVGMGFTLAGFTAGGPLGAAFGIGFYLAAPLAANGVVTWLYNQMGWGSQQRGMSDDVARA